jgi:hypothetical protein
MRVSIPVLAHCSRQQYEDARGTFEAALAIARAAGLEFLTRSRTRFASSEPYCVDYVRVSSAIDLDPAPTPTSVVQDNYLAWWPDPRGYSSGKATVEHTGRASMADQVEFLKRPKYPADGEDGG